MALKARSPIERLPLVCSRHKSGIPAFLSPTFPRPSSSIPPPLFVVALYYLLSRVTKSFFLMSVSLTIRTYFLRLLCIDSISEKKKKIESNDTQRLITMLLLFFVLERKHRAPKRHAKLPQPRTSYEHMIKLVLISFYVDLTRKDV